MLEFDEETTAILNVAYRGGDITRRRREIQAVLAPKPGECIADVGCGNGFMTLEMARSVGPQGRIIGVDPSADMLRAAADLCEGMDQIDLREGLAAPLPIADGALDGYTALQVFEYLDDLPSALSEAHRALRDGGRLAIGDMHFDSWIWHSADPDRMNRMMASWDTHLADRCVPARLPALLGAAGFSHVTVTPVVFQDAVLRPDGLANMLLILMDRHARTHGHLPEGEVQAWAQEQRDLAASGQFFFAITHFIVAASKG